MSRPGWLNDNESRSYPLVPRGPLMLRGVLPVGLPYSALVDFGCVVGPDAGFDGRTHPIYLQSVARAGGRFVFAFRCDAPGLAGVSLRFPRDVSDGEFATGESEATADVPPGAVEPCVAIRDDPLWEGFLTTGLLDDLAAVLPDGEVLVAGAVPPTVEPALVQDLSRGYVRTLNLANEDRTRARAPAGCPEASSEALGGPVDDAHQYRAIVNRECLSGPLTVREGYNCTIRQSARENSLTISAALAGGAGEPCVEVPLAGTEAPPAASTLLTGGPACSEVVNSINGLTGGVIHLVPRNGVRIEPSTTAPNTLVVDFDLRDLTVCRPPVPPTPPA
jgi:hypothetical protein